MSDEEDTQVEGVGEAEEEQEIVECKLTEQLCGDSLSLLCKIGNGLSLAYVKMELKSKALTDISIISAFVHVRYLDISDNKLESLAPLSSLTHLLTLKADNNRLTTASLPPMPYLQRASFQNNKITDTEGITHPLLEVLNLNNNQITQASFDSEALRKLSILEMRGNNLTSTAGLGLPKLQRLYLAENQITELTDLDKCVALKMLHLRGNGDNTNPIEKLDGFSKNMIALQYLNMRGSKISSLKSEIKKLKCLPMLRGLILKDSPVAKEEEYRIEIIMNLRNLERLDKDIFTDEERQEAQELYRQREEEGKLSESNPEGAMFLD